MSEVNLTAEQLDRYARHIIMDDIGGQGQQRLLDSAVLVVGAGGLGAPILQYLAAAGVGTIGIVDDDHVERSNLQRQIIHQDADIGRPKVDSAADYIAALNPDITVQTHETRFDSNNARSLVTGYDVVVDASDNFPTRYLINDICVLEDIPFVHGAVYRFEGQIAAFTGGQPCYRCLFPEAPPDGAVPDCATAGVFGVVPGTIGCIQATETIKSLLSIGDSLAGRIVYYDAAAMSFDQIDLRPDPDCPVCAPDSSIEGIDPDHYTDRCRLDSA